MKGKWETDMRTLETTSIRNSIGMYSIEYNFELHVFANDRPLGRFNQMTHGTAHWY
jgi:hypothetical protein